MPIRHSTFSQDTASAPVAMAHTTVKAAPIPVQTA
jgi:hypothetical protein